MKKKIIYYSITLIIGILLGWIFFHSSPAKEENHNHNTETAKSEIWTCAMHPQIRMEKPGKCPICGMELIVLTQSTVNVDSGSIHLSREAMALANVLTSTVSKQKPIKDVRLYGKVQADERLVQSQVAHIPGRIEKLWVNFTGESVRKGQTLALIYSPELVTAQQELLETVKTKDTQPEMYEASKEKLRQWKLSEKQIDTIENSGQVQNNFEITANTNGIVASRRVNNGDYITQGTILYDIVDLSSVWLMFDAYESDLTFLSEGDNISFTVQALPGSNFTGNIKFIDPVLDPVTRVSKVRVEISNQIGKLKPEMFATGIVEAKLNEFKDKVIIPRSAVLWTGKRSLVYVKQSGTDEPIFKAREVELGPVLGENYVIINGLNEGEEIVTEGTFSVDAAAQLEGKPSMMNNENEMKSTKTNSDEMQKMEVPGKRTEKSNPEIKQMVQQATFSVSGNCELCKERIETAAKSVKGVLNAVWDIDTKKIQVDFSATVTNTNAIEKAIAKVGHDTDKYKADSEDYKNLPECCKYDRNK